MLKGSVELTRSSVSNNVHIAGQVALRVQSKQRREGLLLGQISTSSENDNDRLLLDLLARRLHTRDSASSLSLGHFG